MKSMWQSLRMLAVLSLLTGVLYPLLLTGLAQALFRDQANGSTITSDGNRIGSTLVGQAFLSDKYFWPRPSATGYNPLPSSGTNAGPTSSALRDSVSAWAGRFHSPIAAIPPDLLTASGSGLDPHITPEAARFQTARIVAARGLDPSREMEVEQLIREHTEPPQFGLFGQSRVNVLRLNLALDSLLR